MLTPARRAAMQGNVAPQGARFAEHLPTWQDSPSSEGTRNVLANSSVRVFRDPRSADHAEQGFTLIEVLVALAIVAVALLAALRAVGAMAQNNSELRMRLLAQISAENRIAELRIARAFPDIGSRTVACPQGKLSLECVEETKGTPNPLFRRIEVRVYDGTDRSRVLAELIGILPHDT